VAVLNQEITMLMTPLPKIPTPSPSQIAEKQLGSQPPTQEQIAARAYEIFLAGGSQPGRCGRNWSTAEAELRQQAAAPGGLDKASLAASAAMVSEGAGGAVDDSAKKQGAATRPSQPFTAAGKPADSKSVDASKSSAQRGL